MNRNPMSFCHVVSVMLALLVTMLMPAPATAQRSASVVGESSVTGGAGHEYFYFDEARPLTLDLTRVAVLNSAMVVDAPLPASLAQAGVNHAALTPWSADWQLATLPPPHRSAAAMARLVADVSRELADDGVAGFVSPVFVDDLGGPLVVTRDILVRFRSDAGAAAEGLLQDAGAGEILSRDWAGMSGAYRVRMKSHNGFEVLAAANALAQRPDVIFAEPDFRFTGSAGGGPSSDGLPTDPHFPKQWALRNIGQFLGAPCSNFNGAVDDFDIDGLEAWDITTGDSAIIMVIIDDGVQMEHPDLNIDPALGIDLTDDPNAAGGGPTNVCDNHGTIVAGVAGALLNNLGLVGVAPSCRLATARPLISVLATPCTNAWTSQASWTVDALDWAQSIGARITNNSNFYGFTSSAIASKYEQSRAAGLVHFASAGNSASPQILYPASLCAVNAVNNVGPVGQLHSTSNWGDGLAFCAPGAVIVTTDLLGAPGSTTGDYACVAGTSVSSPHAAGVAALVLSVNPLLSAFEVEIIMRRSASNLGAAGYDTIYGWGMVNALAALTLPPFRLADITIDGTVNVNDLLSVINSWGPCPGICPAPCPADCTGDGLVNVNDLLLVINNWG